MTKDSQIRSITKTFTWRFLATITTMILVYIFTGNLYIVASIGALEVISKIVIYYLHERAWNGISWEIEK